VAALLFYRAHLQAGNLAAFDGLITELERAGLNPLPIALASLKEEECRLQVEQLLERAGAEIILNTTGFAIGGLDGAGSDAAALGRGRPVLQVIVSGGNVEDWRRGTSGLSSRDLAMSVVLPEIDGRIITRAVSFKGLARRSLRAEALVTEYQLEPERAAFVAELAARWVTLARSAPAERRIALVLANYPAKDGRLGNGVGLDTPESTLEILRALAGAGYAVRDVPDSSAELIARLTSQVTNEPHLMDARPALQSLSLAEYREFLAGLPPALVAAVDERWGPVERDPRFRHGRLVVSGLQLGGTFLGIQPARGYEIDVGATYHDPELVPPHGYLAFYAWLRRVYRAQAIVHVGKHGNLEWLPGKSVALSDACWPDAIFGALPHLYPFIVNDPGEGTQAKRRAQAVIIDHLVPPLTRAESYGALRDLEQLVDEYYQALLLDAPRAQLLRRDILALARATELSRELGFAAEPSSPEKEESLLVKVDAYLCELKESQIRDGLHVFGRSPQGAQRTDTLLALSRLPARRGEGRDQGLIAALGRALLTGPEGTPFELTGSELSAPWLGPRPELLVGLCADAWRTHGDTRERLELLGRALVAGELEPPTGCIEVMDRVRGEVAPALDACGASEIAGLLRGLDGRFVSPGPSGAPSRGRLDVLPTGRNFYGVDVRAVPTSAATRLGKRAFPELIRLFDAALCSVAELDETDAQNPVRARVRADERALREQGLAATEAARRARFRIFGSKPGAYGAGLQQLLDGGAWRERCDLGSAYLAASSYAYGVAEIGVPAREALETRLATVDGVLQNQDNREHDVLDSSDYYEFQGGLSAAIEITRGRPAALYHGDHHDPEAPRVRSLKEEIGRVVRSRVVNPKWIAGARRHGYKGASEMAATVDYLFGYGATTGLVDDHQYALVSDAYLLDGQNRSFLGEHNPSALREMTERLLEAMQRGLWRQPGAYREALETLLLDTEEGAA
jgi:cobaltochelatase CobN